MSPLSHVFPTQKVFHMNFLNLGIERPSLVTNFICSGSICPCRSWICAQNRGIYRTIFEFALIRTVNPKSDGRGLNAFLTMIYWVLTLLISPEKQEVFSRTLPCWDEHQDLLPDRQPHHAMDEVWLSVPIGSVQLNIVPRDIWHHILPPEREYMVPYTPSREAVCLAASPDVHLNIVVS